MDPHPPPDWIGSVVRPFGDDPEMAAAVRQDLEERAAAADAADCEALGRRFDEIDSRPRKRRLIAYWLPVALAFVLVMGLGGPAAYQYRSLQNFVTSISGTGGGTGGGDPTDRLRAGLTAEERLFVFGDTSQPTPELAAMALWETQPENAALFGDYLALADPRPPDFLETARGIDPDNGWFLVLAAGDLGQDAVEKKSRPGVPRRDKDGKRTPSDWEIKDDAKFEEALALIEEAAAMSRIEYYGGQLLRERLEILPPERDFVTRIGRMMVAAAAPSGDVFTVFPAASVVTAHTWQCGLEGDVEELQRIRPVVDRLCRALAQQEGSLVVQLVALAASLSMHESLLEACEHAGMESEVEILRPKVEALRAIRKKRDERDQQSNELLRKHADMLTALAMPVVGRLEVGMEPLQVEEMKAGRMMNYALVDRTFLWFGAMFMVVCTAASLAMARMRNHLSFRLGARMMQSLEGRDWLWVLAGSTVPPLLWLLAVTRWTPLGCRDWGLGYVPFQPVATQYTATVYLVVATTLCAIRWRLGKRAGFLGFGPRHLRWALLPVAALALAIPLAGCMRYLSPMVPLYFAVIFASLGSFWLMALAFRAVFGRARHSAYRAAVSLALVPAFALCALFAMALVPLTHRAERQWIAKDELMRTSPEYLGWGRVEAEATRLTRARILEALDAKAR